MWQEINEKHRRADIRQNKFNQFQNVNQWQKFRNLAALCEANQLNRLFIVCDLNRSQMFCNDLQSAINLQ